MTAITTTIATTNIIASYRGRRPHNNSRIKKSKVKLKLKGAEEEEINGRVYDIDKPGKPSEFITTTEAIWH